MHSPNQLVGWVSAQGGHSAFNKALVRRRLLKLLPY